MTAYTKIKLIILFAVLGVGALILAGLVLFVVLCASQPKGPPQPGEAAFSLANQAITPPGSSARQRTFGNTPEAEKMAAEFAKMIELTQKLAFTSKDKSTLERGQQPFMVYCQATEGKICFLTQAPLLRGYEDDDVRKGLIQLCWESAKLAARESHKDKPSLELAVGVRGAILYGGLAIGKADGEPVIEQGTAVDQSKLYRFFFDQSAAAEHPARKVPARGHPRPRPTPVPAPAAP